MTEPTSRQVLLQRLSLVGGTGGGALLTMIWMAWAGRKLGPAASSDFYAAVFLVFAIYMLGHPINGLAARFGALWRAQGAQQRIWPLYTRLMRTLLWVGVPSALIGLPTLAWQADLLHFQEPWALALGLLAGWLAVAASAGRGVLRGVGRLTAFAGSVLTEAVIRLGLGIALLALWPSASAAMAAYVAAGLATVGLGELLVRRALPERTQASPVDTTAERRALLAFAAPMLLMALCDAAYQNLDVLVAKRSMSLELAGQYGAIATLTRALGVLVQPFALLVIPLLTTSHARGERVGRQLAGLTAAFLGLAALPMVVFLIWPRELVVLIYGEPFAPAAPWLAGHAVASLAMFVSLMLAQAFAAVARFAFLWIYLAGVVALGVGLALWHTTPAEMIRVMVMVKGGVLLLIAVWWGVSMRLAAR